VYSYTGKDTYIKLYTQNLMSFLVHDKIDNNVILKCSTKIKKEI